jgi:hypothetical protein
VLNLEKNSSFLRFLGDLERPLDEMAVLTASRTHARVATGS